MLKHQGLEKINYLFSLVTPRFIIFLSTKEMKKFSSVFSVTNKFSFCFFLLHLFSSFLRLPSRSSERDNFIKVNWDNIKEKAWFNFKQFSAHVSMFSTPYDYGSIMHYSPMAFAIDRSKPVLIPLQRALNMGQREGKSLFIFPNLVECTSVNISNANR